MSVKWENAKKRLTEEEIIQVQNKIGYVFPSDFSSHVLQYNGARPTKYFLDFGNYKKRVFGTLLNLDLNEKWNLVKAYHTIYDDDDGTPQGFVPFADDPAGNLFCFDFTQNEQNPSIIFFDHEEPEWEYVCNNFTELQAKFY